MIHPHDNHKENWSNLEHQFCKTYKFHPENPTGTTSASEQQTIPNHRDCTERLGDVYRAHVCQLSIE